MSESARVCVTASVLFALLGLACGDDSTGEPESAGCPADAPTRLWAAPADQQPYLNGHLLDLFTVNTTEAVAAPGLSPRAATARIRESSHPATVVTGQRPRRPLAHAV